MAGILAALEQKLMHHFVEQGAVIGEQLGMILRNVERDRPAALIRVVRAERDAVTEWQGIRKHQRHRSQRTVEIGGVEVAPSFDNRDAQWSPSFTGEASHILDCELPHLASLYVTCS